MRFLTALALVALTACGGAEEAPQPDPAPKKKADTKKKSKKGKKKAKAKKNYEIMKLAADANPGMSDPAKATETAPDEYMAKFVTTKGDFVIQVNREWAPNGADRFYNLVKIGFFEDVAFFRVVDGFMVQFGLSGYPEVNKVWRDARIKDDPVTQSNTTGMVTFATAGPNTRTTQIFINYVDRNKFLDSQGFSPFGKIVEGMDVVNSLYKGYGDGPPRGRGPNQGRIMQLGNGYLKADFDKLDYIKKAKIMK